MKPFIDASKAGMSSAPTSKCEEKATANIRAAGFDVYLPRSRVEKWNKRTNAIHQSSVRSLALPIRRHERGEAFRQGSRLRRPEAFIECQGWPIPVRENSSRPFSPTMIDMKYDDTRAALQAPLAALTAISRPALGARREAERNSGGITAEVVVKTDGSRPRPDRSRRPRRYVGKAGKIITLPHGVLTYLTVLYYHIYTKAICRLPGGPWSSGTLAGPMRTLAAA